MAAFTKAQQGRLLQQLMMNDKNCSIDLTIYFFAPAPDYPSSSRINLGNGEILCAAHDDLDLVAKLLDIVRTITPEVFGHYNKEDK